MSGIRDTIIGPTRSVLYMILRQYTCILEYLSSFPLSFLFLSSSYLFPFPLIFLPFFSFPFLSYFSCLPFSFLFLSSHVLHKTQGRPLSSYFSLATRHKKTLHRTMWTITNYVPPHLNTTFESLAQSRVKSFRTSHFFFRYYISSSKFR